MTAATPKEWKLLRAQLSVLTDDQVRKIASEVGIMFTGSLSATKEDYIDILDEAYWDELSDAYQRVVTTVGDG